MSRSENVQETIANLMGCRMRLQVEAESEVKELRRTILRMGKRRTRIDNLEERLNNLGPEEAHNFRTDVESAGYMMVKEDLVERIKVEKGNMQRDVEFAQRITEKIGEDLTGL